MRRKFNKELLKEVLKKYNAIQINEYNYLTQHTLIKYKCNCGIIYEKNFRGIVSYGGALCDNCCKKNKMMKTKLSSNSEIKLNGYKIIQEKCKLSDSVIIKKIQNVHKDDISLLNISEYKNIFQKLKFKCNKCNTEFVKSLRQTLNTGCPVCIAKASKRNINSTNIFSKDIDACKQNWINKCNILYKNRFDYSNINYINRNVKVSIRCLECNKTFTTSPNTHLKSGCCPNCSPTTELILLNILKKIYSKVLYQFKLENCKFKNYLRFDYCIPDKMIIIELDGEQHFKEVWNWGSADKILERDIYKMNKADEAGYKVIHISQMDVYKYREKWVKDNLIPQINSDDLNHIFISSDNNLYDKHIELFNRNH